jgi:hypothetical protein
LSTLRYNRALNTTPFSASHLAPERLFGGKNYAKNYRNGGALAGLVRLRNVTYAGF